MKNILILGSTGKLGRRLTQQAVQAGHKVSVIVRNPDRLGDLERQSCQVVTGDLLQMTAEDISSHMELNEVVINTAGHVNDGAGFVQLVGRLIEAAERLPEPNERVFWFLAGAGILELPGTDRQLLDMPKVPKKYMVHRENFKQLSASSVEFRLCCPGPMEDNPALGTDRLRVSTDRLPVDIPEWTASAPRLLTMPFLPKIIAKITVPYADVATLILDHLEPGGPFSRKRVGIARA